MRRMNTNKARPTITNIAERAGVSRPTVSQVLNQKGRLSDATRERVLKAAADLGYRPNSYARAIANQSTGNLGMLLSADAGRSMLLSGLMNGMQDAVIDNRMHLVVGRLPDEELTSSKHVPRLLSEFAADGLLINYFKNIPRDMRKLIADAAIPVVWINAKVVKPCVFPDDRGAGFEAANHLITLGCKRIVFVATRWMPGDKPLHYSVKDRQAGYERAMKAAGLEPRTVLAINRLTNQTTPADRRVEQVGEELFGSGQEVDAVITYGDAEAVVVALAAERFGIAPGVDVKISTFTLSPSQSLAFPATVWRIPMREVGYRAVQTLVRMVRGVNPTKSELRQSIPFGEPDLPLIGE